MVPRLARLRRRLDRRLYRALFVLYRARYRAPRWRGPLDPAALRRVLVVRRDRIGDAIVTTPLLSLLRAALPHADIDVVASAANAQIFEGDPRVSRVHVDPRRPSATRALARMLRARGYDAVFSVDYGRGLAEGLFAARVSLERTWRISVYRPPRYAGLFSVTVRPPRARGLMADRLLHLAAATLRLPPALLPATLERFPMRLATDTDAERRAEALVAAHGLGDFALINLWAAEAWREWPPARCAATLRLLLDRHPTLAFVLSPPPGRETEAAAVRDAIGARAVVAPPSARFADVAALVRRARVVVTPDTSLVHAACACGTPVLGLYTGRTVDPERWRPVGVPWRALTTTGGDPIAALEPARVADAFDELLASL